MTNKISNTNKSNIHIHIGDKGKKKRRHHRKAGSKGHSGTYVMNNISAPVQPLFNRPQSLDTSLADERERERVRIQKGIFESQTPSNTTGNFANTAPVNDYNSFVGNLKQYFDEKKKATPKQEGPFTSKASAPAPVPIPAPAPVKEVKHKKQMDDEKHEYKHKEPSLFQHSPSSVQAEEDISVPVRVGPFTSQNTTAPRVGPFTSQNAPAPRVGPFTSQIPPNTTNPLRRSHHHHSHDEEHVRSTYPRELHSDNITNARLRDSLQRNH